MTMVILSPFLSLEGQTSYSIEGRPWSYTAPFLSLEGQLPILYRAGHGLWLEEQTSYSIEDKPWPHHSSLLGDGSNAHPALYRIGSCPSRLKKGESMTMAITPISQ